MINRDIVDYIKIQLQKGHEKENIKNALISAGWQIADIDEAFRAVDQNIPAAPSYGNNFGGSDAASLPGAGVLLGEAWEIYKLKIKTFSGIIIIQVAAMVAVFVGIIFLIYTIGRGIFASSALALIAAPDRYMPPPDVPSHVYSDIISWFTGMAVMFFVVIVPVIIIQVWGQAAMIYAVKDSRENIGVVESYRRSWRKIGALFWVGLLSFMIIAGGSMFFGIPGIIFAVWFSLANYIVVSEDIGGMNALLKSREYIRGRGWEVFGLLLVIFLIWVGVSIGVQFGFAIVSMVFTSSIAMILSLLSWIALAMFVPFFVSYVYLIYRHLRRIRGDVGFDSSSGRKLKYIGVAVLGIFVGAGIFIFPFLLVMGLSGIVG